MKKITLPSGAFHVVETLESGEPDLAGYTTSLNTRAALQAAYDAGHWEPYSPPEPEPEPAEPNWDGFNAAIMVDPRLNAVMGIVLSAAPAIAMGIPAALAQVSQNGPAAFALVFGALCALGGATEGDRITWAAMAVANHLPAEFIAIVRGSNG